MPVEEAVEEARPRMQHKTLTYRTGLEWTSGRSGILSSEGKPAIGVSSPPEFKGEAGRWTPEDLYVAAIEVCTMTTFASFAQRKRIPVLSYRSEAEGALEFVGDGYRFTRVVLRPRIMVADPEAVGAALQAMHDAHASCLIARSVRAEVTVEPCVGVVGGAP